MFTLTQSSILTILINQPEQEYHLSELGRIIGKHPGVFQRGLNSLVQQGYVLSRRRGNQRLVRINTEHPLHQELKNIIQKTCGVEALLRDMVCDLKGIDLALIFGTYARDALRADSDIDLFLVVTDSEVEEIILEKLTTIEQLIQREINYKLYMCEEFDEKRQTHEPFLEEILSEHYILLKGSL